jgi:hypothetical protein
MSDSQRFLAVAEERRVTRAAKRLNVSTSGLSHAIRRLVEDIRVGYWREWAGPDPLSANTRLTGDGRRRGSCPARCDALE